MGRNRVTRWLGRLYNALYKADRSKAPAKAEDSQRDGDTSPAAAGSSHSQSAAVQAAQDRASSEWNVGDLILGLYEVKQIHPGGMGIVYRIHHRGWDVDMAVKSPRAKFFRTPSQKEMFFRECETWAKLGLHSNIVTCHYARNLGGVPHVFAEYVEGGSLKEWIDSRALYADGSDGALRSILDVAIQFAEGLAYAHGQGMVHQDIKPANVMMTADGVVKVTDFGLAKATGGMTEAYCSPEQARAVALCKAGANPSTLPQLTRQTDLWSWAVSILEVFTGEVTWMTGQAAPDALSACLSDGVDDPAIPRIPEKLGQLLHQCLHDTPSDRPNGMAPIVAALKDIYREALGTSYPRMVPQPVELRGGGGLNNRAVVLAEVGKYDEAEQMLRQALEQAPCHPQATYNLWTLLWHTGRATDEQVLERLKAAVRLHPDDWQAAYLLALVHVQRGDPEAAIGVLTTAIAGTPEEDRKSLQSLLSTAKRLGGTEWQRLTVPVDPLLRGVDRLPQLAFRPQGVGLLGSAGCMPCEVRFALQPRDDQGESSADSVLPGLEAQKEHRDAAMLPDSMLHGLESGTSLGDASRMPCPDPRGILGRLPLWPGRTRDCWQEALAFLESLKERRVGVDELSRVIDRARSLEQRLAENEPSVQWAGWSQQKDCLLTQLRQVQSRASDLQRQAQEEERRRKEEADRARKEWEDRVRAHFTLPESRITVIVGAVKGRDVYTGHLNGTVAAWSRPDRSYDAVRWWFPGRGSPITCMSLNAAGSQALSGSEDGALVSWDLSGSKCLGSWEVKGGVSDAVILPDDHRAVVADKSGTLLVLDLDTGNCVWAVNNGSAIRSIAVDASGKLALAGDNAGVLRLWDLATGKCTSQWRGHEGGIVRVAISPVGESCWSAGQDGRLRMWHGSLRVCLRTDRFDGNVKAMSVSRMGHQIAIAAGDNHLLRHVNHPKEWVCLPCPVRLLPSSDALAARARHTALLREANTALEGARFAEAIRLVHEATRVETCTSTPESRAMWAKASRVCARTGIRRVRPERIIDAHSGPVESLYLASDGDFFSQGADGAIGLWKPGGDRTGEQRREGAGQAKSLCLSGDGCLALINYSEERAAELCTTVEGELPWSTRIPYGSETVTSLTLASSGLVAMAIGQRIQLYKPNGQCYAQIGSPPLDKIISVQFSVDGTAVLVGGLRGPGVAGALWDHERKEWLGDFHSRSAPSQPMHEGLWCLSPNRRQVAVATKDRGLELWDMFSGQRLQCDHSPANMQAIAIAPDGRFAAAGGRGGFAGIWDTWSGRRFGELLGPESDVRCAQWLRNGASIALGYDNGEIWIWSIEWELLPQPPVEWRRGIRPLIARFLGSRGAQDRRAMHDSIGNGAASLRWAASRKAREWTGEDCDRLMEASACWGYGAVPTDKFREVIRQETAEWVTPREKGTKRGK